MLQPLATSERDRDSHPSQLHGEDERKREEDGEAPDDDDVQHGAGEPGRGVQVATAASSSPAHVPAAARGRVDDHFVPGTEYFFTSIDSRLCKCLSKVPALFFLSSMSPFP